MGKLRVPLYLFALTLGATLQGATGDSVHRVDFVVGNAIYQNGVALCNAVNDARDMHKTLQDAGFDGEEVENANREAFQAAFKRFIKKIHPGDIATFYYAGEGVQIRGENYLIPVDYTGDGEFDLANDGYSAERIQKQMEDSGARIRIIILDACRNSPYLQQRGQTGLARMESGEGTIIAYATAPGKTASDNCRPGERNGLFTKALLASIRNRRKSIFETLQDAQLQVFQVSNKEQLPYISSGLVETVPLAASTIDSSPTTAVVRDEIDLWNAVRESGDGDAVGAFLTRFPNGVFASAGRTLLSKITSGNPDRNDSALLVSLCGSTTIGLELGPALALEYLKQRDAQKVSMVPYRYNEVEVRGTVNGRVVRIDVKAHGTVTGFEGLAAGNCDVAMASRPISPEDIQKFGGRLVGADMSAPERAHVIGRDGLTIIVPVSNPIKSLTVTQLRDIFSGRIRNWRLVGGTNHPIDVFTRDPNSGTQGIFRDLVMKGDPFINTAHEMEDNRQLSELVAFDPDSIGFVGLAWVGRARAVPLADGLLKPLLPSRETVGTNEYALSRLLLLYTAGGGEKPDVDPFVRFATSTVGERFVETAGFIGKNIVPVKGDVPSGAYKSFVVGAQRLPFSFRFRNGSAELDSEGQDDAQRLIDFLEDPKYADYEVLFGGHTDNTRCRDRSGRDCNARLSLERARGVADALSKKQLGHDVEVQGFGADYPVASGETDDAKALNRRVEVWIRPRVVRGAAAQYIPEAR